MTLDEYLEDIEKGERGEFEDAPGNAGATRAMFRTMVAEIRGAAWQPWARADALALAARAERLGREVSQSTTNRLKAVACICGLKARDALPPEGGVWPVGCTTP